MEQKNSIQITIKDKKLKQFFRKRGRKGARKDFFELLRRSVKSYR